MNLKLLHIFLLSTAGIFLLCTPFINMTELANGLVTGKMCWFHLAMLFFSVCVFLMMSTQKGTAITSTFSDLLVLFFAVIVLITYKWSLNPEPEKLLFAGQLVILWFLLRYILTTVPELNFFLVYLDAHRTGRSRLGNAAIAWACLFPSFSFPADGFFL